MPRLLDKHNPYGRNLPPGPWDYLVIGSGMGGMSCAALLSKLGKRVLVLEQHYVPGGFTHVFRRKGYVWDVGVHAVGEVDPRATVGRVLADLTGSRLEWSSLGGVYDRFHYPGLDIDFPDSKEQFIANLKQAFPAEQEVIDRYFQLVREVAGSMRGYFLARALGPEWGPALEPWLARDIRPWMQRSTQDVLAELTQDTRLRSVLAGQWGYYGSTPRHSAFAIHALVTRHFLRGAYYPKGGAESIARELLRTVVEQGGWTRVTCEVEQIVIEDGRAVGVRTTEGEEIRAKHIVSAAGGLPTVRRLLPPQVAQQAWARSIADLTPSPAHLCLYIGFKGDIRAAGAGPANRWFYETWDTEDDRWRFTQNGQDAPVLYTSFPSLKDPLHQPGPEQRHTGELVTFVPWEEFSAWRDSNWKRRGADYDRLKADLSQRMLAQLLRHMPDLAPLVDYHELSTPLSTEHFARAANGAIYGIEPTPQRFANPWLRPRTPISNLFLTGSDVATVGVIGAFVGGILTALSAEPLRTMRHLRALGA